ncbi:MAG: TAXI family TRAP transporter solute-binding subunit [Sphaerochaetaceae bacterium]|nr:TAXI family TRAP transporter solute-binding subunit [Sphaerochaetaceae bacterium]
MKKLFYSLMVFILAVSFVSAGGSSESSSAAADVTKSAAYVDTNTVAVGAVVIVRDDVPADEVYAIVKSIFENKSDIASQHAKGNELDLSFASSVTAVPYHPGAAKYFAEKGYSVAAVKDNAGTGKASSLSFGTGGDTGTYYGFGSVLAGYVTKNTDYSVTAVTSGGSKANIEDLAANDVQLGFVQSDVMSYAYNGERLFDGAPVKGFSVVAALYMEQVQIVTTNGSILTGDDLKGKTVSIGAIGSGVYFNAIDVLTAYGLTEKDIKPVYQGFGDSADSLKDGKIDAAFVVAGAPTTAITDLATAKTVYLVSIDDAHADALIAASPFYSKYTIPAGTYGSK